MHPTDPENSATESESSATLHADNPSHESGWTSSAWVWVPSLYFTEGLPYIIVMSVSVILYKRMGVSNEAIALYTSLLYLPWVIKPFWSPIVDVIGTTRRWIVATQIACAISLAGVALCLPLTGFFAATLACFWVLAFGSATHDMAADGFYMSGLSEYLQSWFVGIRGSFYKLATIAGQGLLVVAAGVIERNASVVTAWSIIFGAVAAFFVLLAIYHWLVLPPAKQKRSYSAIYPAIKASVVTFFAKPGILLALCFLLLYRFAESQLAKIAPLFLLDPLEEGGLGLTTEQIGWMYGGVGAGMLLLGGVIGGWVGANYGLRRCLFPMALALNVPNLVYIFLSIVQPTSALVITMAIGLEQLGYGFGFAGYMLYTLYLSRGDHETSHYALCTGFMALGMMLPGMVSGLIQIAVGYENFFWWVIIATVPSLIVTALVARKLPR